MKQDNKKMITLTIKFWTNDIATGGKVAPKQMWDSGMARFEKSSLHGIDPGNYLPFNSMAQLPALIEKLIVNNEIQMQLGSKSSKYYAKEQLALIKKK